MTQRCETPRDGGVSRNSCAGCFRDNIIPVLFCTQSFGLQLDQTKALLDADHNNWRLRMPPTFREANHVR